MKTKNGQPEVSDIPPHSLEAEAGMLACAILKPVETGELREDWFYDVRHRNACGVLRGMMEEHLHIDPITFTVQVRRLGLDEECGGRCYVSALADQTGSGLECDYFRPILEEMRLRREALKLSVQLQRRTKDPSLSGADLVAWADRRVSALEIVEPKQVTMVEALRQQQRDIEEASENRGRLRGKPSGWHSLDKKIGGLRAGQLCVVAARPSIGKTAFVMNVAERFAIERKQAVLVFSLEMTLAELLDRASCSLGEVDLSRLNTGELKQSEYSALTKAHGLLVKAPLTILDNPNTRLQSLLTQARRHKPSPTLVVVDYLQLVRAGDGPVENTNEELTEVSNALKMLAKELSCPVLVTSQLNRDCERHDREPILSDLRGSGAIEQAADWVLLLHRPKDADKAEPEMQCILAKQRSGPTGRFKLVFERRFTRFVDPKGKGDE